MSYLRLNYIGKSSLRLIIKENEKKEPAYIMKYQYQSNIRQKPSSTPPNGKPRHVERREKESHIIRSVRAIGKKKNPKKKKKKKNGESAQAVGMEGATGGMLCLSR
jgi:hypothetical protein